MTPLHCLYISSTGCITHTICCLPEQNDDVAEALLNSNGHGQGKTRVWEGIPVWALMGSNHSGKLTHKKAWYCHVLMQLCLEM